MRAVLLLETDPLVHESITKLLRQLGHVVVGAASRDETVKLLDDISFDVFFLSLSKNVVADWATAVEVKGLQPNLKIIIAAGAREDGYVYGVADAIIDNPFSMHAIGSLISRLFDTARTKVPLMSGHSYVIGNEAANSGEVDRLY